MTHITLELDASRSVWIELVWWDKDGQRHQKLMRVCPDDVDYKTVKVET